MPDLPPDMPKPLPPAMAVRPAAPADSEAVARLFNLSFRDTFGHNYPPDELDEFLTTFDGAFYHRAITAPESAVMLGTLGGEPAGFCLLGQQQLPVTTGKRWWVVQQLYLLPAAKGSGMADAMLDWALDTSRDRGFQELYLTVWIDNPRARRFYERRGFVECGKYAYRVGSVIDDDRIMRLTL